MEIGLYTYEIMDHLCTLSEREDGWVKEMNIISWNGSEPKYDIRSWSPDHAHMTRGITLTAEEMEQILQELHGDDAVTLMENVKAMCHGKEN